MITANEKIRAARMFEAARLYGMVEGFESAGFSQQITEIATRYLNGENDHYSNVAQAIRVLNRADDRDFYNAIQAMYYLQGYFSPMTRATYKPKWDRNSDFYWLRLASAWRSGYFASH